MRLLTTSLPILWAVLGWVLLAPAALRSLQRARASRLPGGAQQHVWLAGVVLLGWLWTLQAQSAGGAAFGLLGAALYALIFGRDWARLGLLAALAMQTVLGAGSWSGFGLNGLLLAVVPTSLAGALQEQIERRLPRNIFVFIIGNGLFVTLVVTAVASALLLLVHGLLWPATMSPDQFAYALLLAWGEALASGMLFSALVIFGPQLVLTYRQDRYLPRRTV